MSRSGGVPRHPVMTNIVITGATGVVGRRAVRELLAAGHQVTGVTRSAARPAPARGPRRPRRRGRRLRPGRADDRVRRRGHRRQPSHPHPAARPDGGARRLGRERPPAPRSVGRHRPRGAGRRRRAPGPGVARLPLRRRRRRLAGRGRAGRRRRPHRDGPHRRGQRHGALRRRHRRPALRPVHRAGQRPHPGEHRGRARRDLPEPRPARRVPADRLARRRRRGGRRRAIGAPAGIYNVADDDPPTRAEIDAALAAVVGRGACARRWTRSRPGSSRWRARSASPAGGCATRPAGRRACAPAPTAGA